MSKHIKAGYLRYFHKGVLSKKWKDYYFVLFDDSTLQWYEKQSDHKPDGYIRIRDIARNLCVGPYTRCLPHRPQLPRLTDEANLIALPRSVSGGHHQEIIWILCNDVTHLNDWMRSIVSTLPPAPPSHNAGFSQPGPPPYNAAPLYPRATPYPQQPPSTYGTGGGNSLRDMGIGFAGGALLGGALGYAWGDGWGYGMGPAEPNDGYCGWDNDNNNSTIINNHYNYDTTNNYYSNYDDNNNQGNNFQQETNNKHEPDNQGYGSFDAGNHNFGDYDRDNDYGGSNDYGGANFGDSGAGDFGGADFGNGDW